MVKSQAQLHEETVIGAFMGRLHPDIQKTVKTSMILTLGKMIQAVAEEKRELEEIEELHFGTDEGSW